MANDELVPYLSIDAHGHYFKEYLKEQKKLRLKDIETTIALNGFRKREGLTLDPIPSRYTLREFASELKCPQSTLRKFMTGHGRLPYDLLGRLEYLTKKQNGIPDKDFKKMFIPANKIRQCRRDGCYEIFVLFTPNKVDCDSHRGKSKQKYPISKR